MLRINTTNYTKLWYGVKNLMQLFKLCESRLCQLVGFTVGLSISMVHLGRRQMVAGVGRGSAGVRQARAVNLSNSYFP